MKKTLPLLTLGAAVILTASASVPFVRTTWGVTQRVLTAGPRAATERRMPQQRFVAPARTAPENAVEVPFMHTLGKADDQIANTNLWAVFDVNGDGKGWKLGGFSTYSACTGPDKTTQTCNDDWLISPPVHLLSGHSYTVGFEEGVNTPDGKKAAVHSLWLGESQSPEGMKRGLIDGHEVASDFTPVETTVEVEADGWYCFGLHNATTVEKTAIAKLRNFTVYETGEAVIPPAAGTLDYTLAPGGELKATVHYTAPVSDTEGNALESITRVEVKTNWVPSHTFSDVQPGETITFETTLYHSPYNRIEATAYSGDIAGEPALITDFYAGPDCPLAPVGLTAELSEDFNSVTLSWEPVGEDGENGGYVDTSKVTYYIFDAFGSYYDPPLRRTTGTSVTFDYTEMEGQDFVAYQVTAGVDDYYSLEATSDIVAVGQPDGLPFTESFADACYSQLWAVDPASTNGVMCGTVYDNELQTNADDGEAAPEYLNSQDGDNGFFYFMPLERDASYGFFSTKIDLGAAIHPVMEFWYQGKGSAIDAMVSAEGGDFVAEQVIDLKENPTTGWTLCRVDLGNYSGSKYIQIELRLRAIHNTADTMWSVPVDNIRVRDLVPVDLRLASLSVPASVTAGDGFALSAVVENLGTEAAGGKVTVTADDWIGEVAVEQLAADGQQRVALEVPVSLFAVSPLTVSATVSAEGDACSANDTLRKEIEVKASKLPAPTGLTAAAGDEGVSLGWTAPVVDFTAERVCEDFENPDYPSLTKDDFGGWTLLDRDGLRTYTFLQDVNNPYRTQPMAWQLFDPVAAGVPDDYMADATAHSGSRMLVAWSSQGQNDNWLISPVLSGEAQRVSFWALGFSVAFPEEFEVLWSEGSVNPADFMRIDKVEGYPASGIVPEVWSEYSVELPAGAGRFAIRHTSYDSYALYVDDITYTAAPALPASLSLRGYHVWRDGAAVSDLALTEDFVDVPAESGHYTYAVSAVYNLGESMPSEAAAVDYEAVGVEGSSVDGVSITSDGGVLSVSVAVPTDVRVADMQGRVYYCGKAEDTVKLQLPAGVVLVQAGGRLHKIVIQ